MWGLCLLLTSIDYLPVGHPARTDVKIAIIQDAPWFRFPYPGECCMNCNAMQFKGKKNTM